MLNEDGIANNQIECKRVPNTKYLIYMRYLAAQPFCTCLFCNGQWTMDIHLQIEVFIQNICARNATPNCPSSIYTNIKHTMIIITNANAYPFGHRYINLEND